MADEITALANIGAQIGTPVVRTMMELLFHATQGGMRVVGTGSLNILRWMKYQIEHKGGERNQNFPQEWKGAPKRVFLMRDEDMDKLHSLARQGGLIFKRLDIEGPNSLVMIADADTEAFKTLIDSAGFITKDEGVKMEYDANLEDASIMMDKEDLQQELSRPAEDLRNPLGEDIPAAEEWRPEVPSELAKKIENSLGTNSVAGPEPSEEQLAQAKTVEEISAMYQPPSPEDLIALQELQQQLGIQNQEIPVDRYTATRQIEDMRAQLEPVVEQERNMQPELAGPGQPDQQPSPGDSQGGEAQTQEAQQLLPNDQAQELLRQHQFMMDDLEEDKPENFPQGRRSDAPSSTEHWTSTLVGPGVDRAPTLDQRIARAQHKQLSAAERLAKSLPKNLPAPKIIGPRHNGPEL